MAFNGVRTTDLPALNAADSVVANRDGTTGAIPFATLVALINATTGPTYQMLADLNADLEWTAGVLATVWGETDDALNGVYQKSGVTGAGAWAWVRPLPLTTLGTALLNTKADEKDLAALQADVEARAVGLSPAGAWDASSGAFPADAAEGTFYVVSIAGTVDGQTFAVGDWLIALVMTPANTIFAGNWTRANYSEVVAAALIDPPVFKVGTNLAGPSKNTLYVNAPGRIDDGELDYGLTVASFQPGIALIDNSNAQPGDGGQALISARGGTIALKHDPANNDGSVGSAANTDTVTSAVFGPAAQKLLVNGQEKLVLDANGLRLDGQNVSTDPITRHQFNNPTYTGADLNSTVFVIENLSLKPGAYLIEVNAQFTYTGPGGAKQEVVPICFRQSDNLNLVPFFDRGSGAFEQTMLSSVTGGLIYCTELVTLTVPTVVKVGFSQGSRFGDASHVLQVLRPRVTIHPVQSLNT
ncbi:hypothetical protein [Yoonia sp. R2-816]|uniref:hypothetical protein n=1 Tax=Yoonia sp. R2-816 TaxID=3342638 RepID=UPI00372C35B8